ncbi:MAG: hypothetical protein K8U57_15765 [Planctomycetes bacterium]|nr:hypothetical protein [Planctomycetota bacterium]
MGVASVDFVSEFEALTKQSAEAGDLAVCPRCEGQAIVHPPTGDGRLRTLTCGACGYSKRGAGQFRYWLRIECCGRVLWARNAAHLTLLERYIASDLRTEAMWPQESRDNRRMLPKWVCLARNRDKLLQAVALLRASLV